LLRKIPFLILFLFCSFLIVPKISFAQERGQQLRYSQQFRLGSRIIRVAEPGQLADSVNVWGDVNSAGRYLIPEGTSLPKLLSYSLGPRTITSNQTQLNWSKMRIEVNVSNYSPNQGRETVANFKYKFDEPLPKGMRNYVLENDDIVSVRVKRKPSFVDYIKVIAPVVSTIATGFLIIQRL
jgi:hypothetical protein